MALVLANRVQETTTTTGTGTITLAGAVSGFQSFAAIGNTNTTYYTITSGVNWEVGVGTYTLSGTTLARTTVLSSSAGGTTKITLAGTSNVFATYPAEKSVNLDASGNATALGVPASGTVTNLTGTASININGTVGATTAAAGLFTTLGASAAVTLSPANANVVLSPTGTGVVTISPATAGTINRMSIGATTTSTGAFTTLTASGAVTLSPASANVVLSPTGTGVVTISPATAGTINNMSIGATTTSTGAFTTISGSTSLTTPLQSGGTAVSSTLTLQSTSGAGTSDAIIFKTGSQVEQFRVLTGGGITSAALVDAVGYKGLPQNSQTASYTLALTDMGKMVNTTTGGIVIPANSSVAFPTGSTVIVYNNSASNQTISITTDTIYLAGTATTGSRTLAQRGLATLVKVASTTWVASGAGVT